MRPSLNAAAAATLTVCALLVSASPAAADPDRSERPKAAERSEQPGPPTRMSAVGGERLARPGTQVAAAPGVKSPPPDLTARAWIVADAESGDVLASHNSHWRMAPASTLKMLFADTLLPKLDKNAEHLVTLDDLAAVEAGSSLVGIKEDHTYTVHDLWLGVFLASGNDAVHVLSAMNGGVPGTVEEMQRHAEELGADDTHVVSPDGFDAPDQFSSAYDLTLIARSGLQKADFREYCSTVTAQFPGGFTGKGKKKKRETFAVQNTNRLLAGSHGLEPYKGMAGVKNGYTSHAGNTFTGVAERDGRTLLVTVMHPDSGGNAVYEEAAELLDWGFESADGVEPVGVLVPPKSAGNAAGTPGKGKGKKDAVAAQGPQPGTAVAGDGSQGIWSALAVAGGALLLVAGAGVLVHRRWPLPALVTGVRTRRGNSPGAVPPPARTQDPDPAPGQGPAPDRGPEKRPAGDPAPAAADAPAEGRRTAAGGPAGDGGEAGNQNRPPDAPEQDRSPAQDPATPAP